MNASDRRFPGMFRPSAARARFVLFFVASLLMGGGEAAAQAGEARVSSLTEQAMTAYTNLDLDRAKALLRRAIAEARRRRVQGRALAEVYVALGVVEVGGFNDATRGAEAFAEAIRHDPTVEVDRMVSNPEIDAAFRYVRRQAGIGPEGGRLIPHEPATEQLERTPVPVYIEVPQDVDVRNVVARYWTPGAETYQEIALEEVGQGYGVELPCGATSIDGVSYYIVVLGDNGRVVAQSGSEDEPFTVPTVAQRTSAPAALPTRRPPSACESDCPEGESCEGVAVGGGACDVDADCGGGLACESGVCVSDEAPTARREKRFFTRIGFGAGSAMASQGGLADSTIPFHPSTRPDGFTGVYAPPGYTEEQWAAEIPVRYQGYIDSSASECGADPGQYCVRVEEEGLVFTSGFDLTVGYLIVPRLAVTAGARIGMSAGQGTLARVLLTAGLEIRIVDPVAKGLFLSAAGGVGIGQIQLRVPQGGSVQFDGRTVNIAEPFIQTGLGAMHFSFITGYRISEGLAIYLKPVVYGMFPERTLVFEGAAGVEIAF